MVNYKQGISVEIMLRYIKQVGSNKEINRGWEGV